MKDKVNYTFSELVGLIGNYEVGNFTYEQYWVAREDLKEEPISKETFEKLKGWLLEGKKLLATAETPNQSVCACHGW